MGRKPNKLKFVVDADGKEIPAKEPSSYIKLKIEYNALLKAFNELKEKQSDLDKLKAEYENYKTGVLSRDTTELNKLREENKKLKAIKPEVKTLKETIEVPIKLAPNEYIMELDSDLSKKIVRCIAYLKHKDKLKEVDPKDYLKVFTELALNYLIKENFNDIIK